MCFSEELFLDHKSSSMRQFLQSAVHLQFFKQVSKVCLLPPTGECSAEKRIQEYKFCVNDGVLFLRHWLFQIVK